MIDPDNLTPDIEAFAAVSQHDAGGEEVRAILDALATDDLRQTENIAVRVIWAARDVRWAREHAT